MITSSPMFRGLACHVVMAGSESAAARSQLDWAREKLKEAGFNAVTALVAGEPEPVIGNYVQTHQVDMLVMGAYGHSRIRQLLVGSTTMTMIRTSSVPVLLLR